MGEDKADITSHLQDQELLLAADGELPRKRAARASAHLAACWSCRARLRKIEATIGDVVNIYAREFDPGTSSATGSRALLKARLSEIAEKSRPSVWNRLSYLVSARRATAYAATLLVLAGIQLLVLRLPSAPALKAIGGGEMAALPNPNLTPGATRRVSMDEICAVEHEQVVRPVSSSLRKAVLQKYGLRNARIGDYEIDYLITPGLGGADDINNLWPEPYSSTVWNAHVKDSLEERLHQMVCEGKIDLPTAQHDIAVNWISAYRKYFQTDQPAGQNSRLGQHPRSNS